jgi:hypothetical protein
MHRWPAPSIQAMLARRFTQLANDAFYLIGSALFRCVEHRGTTKSKVYFLF